MAELWTNRYIQLGDVSVTQLESKRKSKNFDVLSNYAWTLTKLNEAERAEILNGIPYVELIEYELNQNAVHQSLRYWTKLFATGSDELIYEGLYSANETGVKYKIPYFSPNFWNSSQTWANSETDIFSESNKGMLASASKALLAADQAVTSLSQSWKAITGNGNRADGVQENISVTNRFSWQGASMNPIDIQFPLFNTGGGSEDNITKNRELIQNLQISHLHSKYEKKYVSPPAIFSLKIPGQRVSPICVIKDLSIDNIGQINMMGKTSSFSGFPTPDAWMVKLTMQELVPQTRETLLAAINPNGVDKPGGIRWEDKVKAIWS